MSKEVMIVGTPEDNSKAAIAVLDEVKSVLKNHHAQLHIIDDDKTKLDLLVDEIIANPNIEIVIFQNSMYIDSEEVFRLTNRIKENRKDIFVAAMFHSERDNENIVYAEGVFRLKRSAVDLLCVFTPKKINLVVAPEETKYYSHLDAKDTFKGMISMIDSRIKNTYPSIDVQEKDPKEDFTAELEANLIGVVQYCLGKECFSSFKGKTKSISFASRIASNNKIIAFSEETIKNKSDKNNLIKNLDQFEISTAELVSENEINVIGNPSSDLTVFNKIFIDHPEIDSIIHLHVKEIFGTGTVNYGLRPAYITNKDNCENSLESAAKISKDMKDCKSVYAAYISDHGPYIGFNKDTPLQDVIRYIESNFVLSIEQTESKKMTESKTNNSQSSTDIVISQDLANILHKSVPQFVKGLTNSQLSLMYNDLRSEVLKRKQENKEYFQSTDSYKDSKKLIEETCEGIKDLNEIDQVVVQAEIVFNYTLDSKEAKKTTVAFLNRGKEVYLCPEIGIDKVEIITAFRKLADGDDSVVEDIAFDDRDKEEITQVLVDRLESIEFNSDENYDKYERELKFLFPDRFSEITKFDEKCAETADKIAKVLKDNKQTELDF